MTTIEIGEGLRGCSDEQEFNSYNPFKVYLLCLKCYKEWEMHKSTWEASRPTTCPNCSEKWIEHKFIIRDSIPKKWVRIDDELQEIDIEDPVRRAVIKKIVQIDRTTT